MLWRKLKRWQELAQNVEAQLIVWPLRRKPVVVRLKERECARLRTLRQFTTNAIELVVGDFDLAGHEVHPSSQLRWNALAYRLVHRIVRHFRPEVLRHRAHLELREEAFRG